MASTTKLILIVVILVDDIVECGRGFPFVLFFKKRMDCIYIMHAAAAAAMACAQK